MVLCDYPCVKRFSAATYGESPKRLSARPNGAEGRFSGSAAGASGALPTGRRTGRLALSLRLAVLQASHLTGPIVPSSETATSISLLSPHCWHSRKNLW
jgi:hypothetical protein